jgi:hypothetical protein
MLRRRGGVPLKMRDLRELLCRLRKSYDAALGTATTAKKDPSSGDGGGR